MRPEYHQAIIDTVRYYGWKKIIYMYDSHDGKSIFWFLLTADILIENKSESSYSSSLFYVGILIKSFIQF